MGWGKRQERLASLGVPPMFLMRSLWKMKMAPWTNGTMNRQEGKCYFSQIVVMPVEILVNACPSADVVRIPVIRS